MSDAEQTTRTLGRALLDEFGRGWSKGKVEVLLEVFSDDPVFLETPFSEPLLAMVSRMFLVLNL